jgi:hypothetical protein
MKERKLFQEVPGRRNDFHSAVLTSYSFNFHHFEYQVLRTLRQKWITNISVLVDQHMLDGSIGLASGNLKQLSQSYSVNGIKSTGAFHPKINFLVGDDKLLLFFGSGNITPGGHGKNHELFTTLYADSRDAKQLPILQEAWKYLEGLTHDVGGYNKERITRQIVSNSSLLRNSNIEKHTLYPLDEGIEVALLYNDSTSIFSQIVGHIPANEINRISVICPYFDEDGSTLIAFADHFNNAILDIYLPEKFGLPPVNIQEDKRINFYKWEETKRGKLKIEISKESKFNRRLHSKIFHFEAADQEYLILGSANATRAGLGTIDHKGANDEFCALYKSPNFDFLDELGIKGKKPANVKDLSRSTFVTGDESRKSDSHHKIFIQGVDIRGHTLHIYLKNYSIEEETSLLLYNSQGEEVYRIDDFKIDDESTCNLAGEALQKELSYVVIVNSEGYSISNKQLINYLDKLFHTDPSKANRSINQVINGLETGAINEFEILAYLNDANQVKDTSQSKSARLGAREEEPEDSPTVEMSYDEAVEATKNPLKREKIIRTHNSVRLWESISKMLLDTIQRRDDELEDEEEDADATKSNLRKNPMPPPQTPKGIKVEQLIGQIQRLVKKYKSSLTHVINVKDHQIDVIDFVQFLLVTHIVTALTYFNNGEAFKKKKGEGYTDPDWHFKLQDTFKIQMKDILTSFNKLLIQCELKGMEDSDDQYAEDRILDYRTKTIYNSMLYLHLIDTLSPEPFMYENIELLAFNHINRLGLTDSQFEQYLDDISRTEDEVMFNVSRVVRLRNNLEEKFVELDSNDNYFRIIHSGWCGVIEKNDKEVRYKSIFGSFWLQLSKYKKYKKC